MIDLDQAGREFQAQLQPEWPGIAVHVSGYSPLERTDDYKFSFGVEIGEERFTIATRVTVGEMESGRVPLEGTKAAIREWLHDRNAGQHGPAGRAIA